MLRLDQFTDVRNLRSELILALVLIQEVLNKFNNKLDKFLSFNVEDNILFVDVRNLPASSKDKIAAEISSCLSNQFVVSYNQEKETIKVEFV